MRRPAGRVLRGAAAILGGFSVVSGVANLVGVVSGSGAPVYDTIVGLGWLVIGATVLFGYVRPRAPRVWVVTVRVVGWLLLGIGLYLAAGAALGLLSVANPVVVVVLLATIGAASLRLAGREESSVPAPETRRAGMGGTALESPGLRESLHLYRRRGLAMLVIGAVLVAAFGAAAAYLGSEDDALAATGRRLPGTVTSRSNGVWVFQGSITVAFDHGGTRRTARVWLNDSSPAYDVGEQVTVIVDPDDEDHVSVAGESNDSPFTVWPMVFALVGGFIMLPSGVGAVVRARRQERMLSCSGWTTAPVSSKVVGSRSSRWLVRVETSDEPAVLTIASCLRSRIARSGLMRSAVIEYVGDPSEYIVLRVPGSAVLLSARPGLTARSRRRWARAFG